MQPDRPDFLCIGAQRAGTTWLWKHLMHHPQVWMPYVKELHYFDRSSDYPSVNYLASDNPFFRLFGRQNRRINFIKQFSYSISQALYRKQFSKLPWLLRYYFGIYNDNWYLSLFREGRGKIRGEITPEYAILDKTDVEHISRLLPDLKIIYMLRNPVDRAWSQVRFCWSRGWIKSDMDFNELKVFIGSVHQTTRAEYLRTIDVWTSCFSKDQFFLGFYDDIIARPGELMDDIFSFLGAERCASKNGSFSREKINSAPGYPMPPQVRRYLTELYFSTIETLSQQVGGPAAAWLNDAREVLDAKEHAEY